MGQFSYSARDKSGAITKGSVFAADRPAATASLVEKGLTPILVKEAAGEKGPGLKGLLTGGLSLGKGVRLQDKVVFSRQFATMINAGVPIVQSLNILREQTESQKLKKTVAEVSKQVEGGSTLASALAVHPEVFNPIYVNMVKAGETGGILDQVLDRLATQQEKDAEVVSKVRSAMIYPAVITTATVSAFFFLMTVIVPKLSSIFEDAGAQLPIYTKIMLAISHFLVNDWYFVIGGFVAAVVLFIRWRKTPGGKRTIDRLILKAPIFGPIIVKVNIARFSRTFGSLMASGISVLDAINATKTALGNSVYQDELAEVAQKVKNGRPMSEHIRASKNFPAIVGQMLSVGEETGQLDSILLKLAEFYEKEVDTVVSGITSIIEPILIIVLGGMVGFIVISVFGPISSIGNSI
ncbi:MAG TPA: type II secretion system F family protein [Candidatus Saccharimonadia bacterium]|nr:type II secretion system F family protein [Candidatus Saccharimonadia bacterium]